MLIFWIGVLAFTTAFWIVGIVLWLVFCKGRVFDPRIYVLYGLFHWLMVGQLGTLLGFNFYEPKPVFDVSLHAKAALLITGSVLFFLLGFSILPGFRAKRYLPRVAPLVNSRNAGRSHGLRVRRLIFITLFLGIVGKATSLYFQHDPRLIIEWNFVPMLVTYWAVAGAVLAIHLLIQERVKFRSVIGKAIYIILIIISLMGIFLSNVMFVFPLFYFMYSLWIQQSKAGMRFLLRNVYIYGFLVVLVSLWSIIFKTAGQKYISTGRLEISTALSEILRRWITLDLFNPESYGIVLHSFEIYAETGQMLGGRSLLVFLPFLRWITENIRGLGRIIVLDIYGPAYLSKNVGWAVPPIGELVANFWYLSPLVYYFLLGIVCRFLYRIFKESESRVFRIFYGMFLPWLFVQQRGDFLNGTVIPAYVIGLVTLSLWFSTIKTKKKGKFFN